MNTDYKLLARIMARRLRQVVADQLQYTQYCGDPGNTINDAMSYVHDVTAHAESTGTPTCILTLDFHNAFDRISHANLFNILPQYGISPWFLERIRTLYTNTTPSVQINGNLAAPISIQALSMVLYALCLHPFLCALSENLEGIQFGLGRRCTPVVAYADDITVFVTNRAEFKFIHQTI